MKDPKEIGMIQSPGRALEPLIGNMSKTMANMIEKDIEEHLRITFRIKQQISVHRPWWMPEFLYYRLMRSILIEQTPITTRTAR